MFAEYKIFSEINEEQLKTLLPCVEGRVRLFAPDTDLILHELGSEGDLVGLILDGVVTAGEQELHEGDTVGHGTALPSPVTKTQAAILTMKYKKIAEPCWFSCHFHWKLFENLR